MSANTSPVPKTSGVTSIAFVDSDISQSEALIQGLQVDKVFLLNGQTNAIEQIAHSLGEYQNLESVHIFSHGGNNILQFANGSLSQTNLKEFEEELMDWGKALSPGGDLLFYGCNLAAGGDQFIQQISQLTQADVAASDDITGHTSLNGDWDLERTVGNIEAAIAVNQATQADYQGELNLLTNGSFEANAVDNDRWATFAASSVAGWQSLNGERLELWDSGHNGVFSSDGTNHLELDYRDGSILDGIYQDVQTTAGNTYELTFDARARRQTLGSATEAVIVEWNGTPVKTVQSITNNGGWTTFTATITGNVGSDRILLRESLVPGASDGLGPLLDNIRLQDITPEPPAGDTTPPTASLTAANITTDGGEDYTFTVTYTDAAGVDTSTLDNNDIQVVRADGLTQQAELVTTTNGIATYRITAPGGTWNTADNGTYTVQLLANQVSDINGNAMGPATLGGFDVTIEGPPTRAFPTLINGSFEANPVDNDGWSSIAASSVPGWQSLNGESIEFWDSGHSGVTSSDGSNHIELDYQGSTNLDGIYQDVQTVAGDTYTLSFDIRARSGNADSESEKVVLEWNGTILNDSFQFTPNGEWTTVTTTVTGTGGSDRITLRESDAPGASDGYGPLLDNIRIRGVERIVNGSFEANAVDNDRWATFNAADVEGWQSLNGERIEFWDSGHSGVTSSDGLQPHRVRLSRRQHFRRHLPGYPNLRW